MIRGIFRTVAWVLAPWYGFHLGVGAFGYSFDPANAVVVFVLLPAALAGLAYRGRQVIAARERREKLEAQA